jgi:hypothetical protein
MSKEIVALAQPRQEPPTEGAYQAVFAALSESARGRAFLAEYARRNRHADTEVLLAALARLEAKVASERPQPTGQLQQELRALLETIRSARPQIDARPLPARAAKLAGLLDLLASRIEEMAEAKVAEATPPADETLGAHAMPEDPMDEPARSYLAVVEPPDEPELPIPSPASAAPPTIVLVHDPEKWEPVFGQDHAQTNKGAALAMPGVSVFDSAPRKPDVVEPAPAPPPATMRPPADPLAAIMALSEDERIALFT